MRRDAFSFMRGTFVLLLKFATNQAVKIAADRENTAVNLNVPENHGTSRRWQKSNARRLYAGKAGFCYNLKNASDGQERQQ